MKDAWFDRDEAVREELEGLAPGLDAQLRGIRTRIVAEHPDAEAARQQQVLSALPAGHPVRRLHRLRYAMAACLAGLLPLLWWTTRSDGQQAEAPVWSEQLALLSNEELAELASATWQEDLFSSGALEQEAARWSLDWSDLLQDGDREWLLSDELEGPFPGLD
jgi:hypothetical protein